jgi:glyoxylase-like metal-dependent hydrolase (beta-lactamase superfamily II)
MDGSHTKEKRERARLDYPFGPAPAPGVTREVAPGVTWLRLPLPFRLDHINVWLIEEKDGFTVVDTGLNELGIREIWESVFTDVMKGHPARCVVVTHLHPDHVGLAGWLVEKFDAPLLMTRTEYLLCRTMVADTGREAPPEGLRFYKAAGFSEEKLALYRKRFGFFGSAVHRLPQSFLRLQEGDRLTLGGREWQVVVGRGHSPEHACLVCPALNIVIAGDQILPRISSNVSVHPTEPEANPLGDWLSSCARLKTILPADILVLPSHNEPFRGAHSRLDALIRGHETALAKLEALCRTPKRAVDVFGALFLGGVTDATYIMATGESIAHLNYLVAHGRMQRERDLNGVDWYRAIA